MFNYFDKTNCACGKSHVLKVENIIIEKDAEKHLNNLTKKYNNILILSNEISFNLCGDKILNCLDGKKYTTLIFNQKIIILDEQTVKKVNENLDGVDLILAIGSGVIQDLAKYTSFTANIDYFIVATAPSMDGYASNVAVMFFNGQKTTIKTHLPKAIIANVDVIKNAPLSSIQSGFGDIIGKYSSLCDWKLSNLLYGEYFCEYIYDLVNKTLQKTVSFAEKIFIRDDDGIKVLMESLIIVGIAMSFMDSSRPCSGSEHHIAHFFEVTGVLHNKPYLSHGKNVAYASLITAKIRQKLLMTNFEKARSKVISFEEYITDMSNLYKNNCFEYMKLQKDAGRFCEDRYLLYVKYQDDIKKILKTCPTYEEIKSILEKCGLSFKEFTSFYGKNLILYSLKYSKYLKDRFSVLWLFNDLINTPDIHKSLF
ncbi:MAG: sn-glycerol-1-phosphate dehydrogenase [Clostridia bacterium]|nr:sn-glycerol-1-phosphate dehydrogenase [Clostridia bacterium]